MSDLLLDLEKIKQQFNALFNEVECLHGNADALNEERHHEGLSPVDNSYEIWDHIYCALGEVRSAIKFCIEEASTKKYTVDLSINYNSKISVSAPLDKHKIDVCADVMKAINSNIHSAFSINTTSHSYIDAELSDVNIVGIEEFNYDNDEIDIKLGE
jgi:hypothetical protein